MIRTPARILFTLILSAFLTPAVTAAPDDDPPSRPDPVDLAIKRAVDFLYKSQNQNNWEMGLLNNGLGDQSGGVTSMAVYGLLAAGESPQKPQIKAALEYLEKAEVTGTYALAMKLQSWNYLPAQLPRKTLKKDANTLMNGVNPQGPSAGLYHYNGAKPDGTFDLSCSNYGVLGMWAAAQQNIEVPDKYWELVDKAWRAQQEKDGGWQYMGTTMGGMAGLGGIQGIPNVPNIPNLGGLGMGGSTLSITAAGVATLFITQDMLTAGRTARCEGNPLDPAIARGLEWMSKNYKGGDGNNLYGMYNVERVGTASGYKYFNTVDWYKEGVQTLLRSQMPDGSWLDMHGGQVPGTVWVILFLIKGRAPIMMNKLEYEVNYNGDKAKNSNWNQRPRDAANLARWTGTQLEKELNWQIVNLKVDIEDLHDSPILYMAGNQAIGLTKEEKEKLKRFVEGGGLILGHADCSDSKFAGSFTKFGRELFPEYEFRELPHDHLIYKTQFSIKNKVPLKGLSNGARELMLLIPSGDPGKFWQSRNFSSTLSRNYSELAANIYLYALDKTALRGKFKGQSYTVKRDEAVPAKSAAKVARLEYAGNWNPEPGAWRRFANIEHNTKGLDLAVEPLKLGEGKLKDYKIAHLTGTAKFKLTDPQRKELQDFVNAGGTLIIDAAGGAMDFKESAEAELTAMFPASAAAGLGAPLPLNHAVYAAGGPKLAKAKYRAYAKRLLVSNMSTPRLRGIEVNNRTAIIFSPEDLTVGMVGMSFDGIYGYEPAYATELMDSIVAYSLSAGAPNKVAAGTGTANQ